MNSKEIDRVVEHLYRRFGKAMGIDRGQLQKCVEAIIDLNDHELERKLRKLI